MQPHLWMHLEASLSTALVPASTLYNAVCVCVCACVCVYVCECMYAWNGNALHHGSSLKRGKISEKCQTQKAVLIVKLKAMATAAAFYLLLL